MCARNKYLYREADFLCILFHVCTVKPVLKAIPPDTQKNFVTASVRRHDVNPMYFRSYDFAPMSTGRHLDGVCPLGYLVRKTKLSLVAQFHVPK